MDQDLKITRKKVKRTESYKLATRRKQSLDALDESFVGSFGKLETITETTEKRDKTHNSWPNKLRNANHKSRENHDRNNKFTNETILGDCGEVAVTDKHTKTHNSWPNKFRNVNRKSNSEIGRKNLPTNTQDKGTINHERIASVRSHTSESADPHRTGSQKSGTIASSDTDDDKRSTSKMRKKKSVFKRIKERLIQTFRKTKQVEDEREDDNVKDIPEHASGSVRHDDRQFFMISDMERNSDVRVHECSDNLENDDTVATSPYNTSANGISNTRTGPPDLLLNLQHGAENSSRSVPLNIPSSSNRNNEQDLDNQDDNDSVSVIFDDLIDPSTPFLRIHNRTSGPDKSKLTLDGLDKFRPKSFENKRTDRDREWFIRENNGNCQSPGRQHLYSDAESTGMSDSSLQYESDFHDLHGNHQRRLYDFGRRFAAIADRLVDERERGIPIIHEQGDRQGDIPTQMVDKAPSSVLPIITRLATSRDYREFHQVVLQELSNTSQWDQVAWYTYLMKSTMSLVGTGRDLGRRVNAYAKRYFNWQIRPWIESRPNGWESVYEETDVEDSELD